MISPADRWRDQLLQWTAPLPEQAADTPTSDGWRAHAHRFRAINRAVQGREEPLITLLGRWWAPEATLLDVGAGGGRFALPLAERDWRVTAAEPSQGMRDVLAEAVSERGVSLDILPLRWPPTDALPRADVVLCANVLYDVADLAPFVAALDRAARQAVVVYLSLTHPVGHLADLWREFRGWRVPDGPTYLDAAAVMFDLGIPVNATLLPVTPTLVFDDLDAALAAYRERLGLRVDPERDAALRATLAGRLVARDGRLVMPNREPFGAALWWEKAGA